MNMNTLIGLSLLRPTNGLNSRISMPFAFIHSILKSPSSSSSSLLSRHLSTSSCSPIRQRQRQSSVFDNDEGLNSSMNVSIAFRDVFRPSTTSTSSLHTRCLSTKIEGDTNGEPYVEIHSMLQFDQFLELAKSENKLAVVDFYAKWCGPCRFISPAFKRLSEDKKYNGASFCKIDVDENNDIAAHMKGAHLPGLKELINDNLES